MHFPALLTAALSAAPFFAVPAAAAAVETIQRRAAGGSVSLEAGDDLLTFRYSTDAADSKNWIGVFYASGGGPAEQEHVEDCPTWEYAPEADGSVRISTDPIASGQYTVYYLASDGYEWLADPINVTVSVGDGGALAFVVDEVTLAAARQGDAYEARVAGLVGGADAVVEFSKTGGDAWVEVARDGTVTGTPDSASAQASVTVRATASDGSTADLGVAIPVRGAGEPLADELRVLSYNLWHGGSKVNGYHAKQVRFLAEQGVDVAGLQEANDPHTRRLAEGLGWHYWQSAASTGIISRYPIAEEHEELSNAGGVRIALDGGDDGGRQLNLWSMHLGYTPYGPYDFCYDQMSVEEVMEREAESGRTPQIEEILATMAGQIGAADSVPVVLLGDTNAPSHLDWTEALKEKNCGYADVPWPTSKKPADAGLTDSFREAHPDPAAEEGVTWSPLFPYHDGSSGEEEPQDRIDFIYYAGGALSVAESSTLVVGDPKPSPDHEDNEWTSDHRALLTVFRFS